MTDINQFGMVALVISMAYATGVLWYNVLGVKHSGWMRIAALPLIGIVVTEGIWDNYSLGGAAKAVGTTPRTLKKFFSNNKIKIKNNW